MIATHLETGAPGPELVAQTVSAALRKTSATTANSVLLLLTPHYASQTLSALRAATQTSQCLQVSGCVAPSIMTDSAISQNQPACAAMVFTGPWSFQTASQGGCDCWLGHSGRNQAAFSGACLSTPGNPAHPVWRAGRIEPSQELCLNLPFVHKQKIIAQGAQALTAPLPVKECYGQDLAALGSERALPMLARELPVEWRHLPDIPISRLAAGLVLGDPQDAIREGRYRLLPIQGTNAVTQTVTLPEILPEGSWLFWAHIQPAHTERSLRQQLAGLRESNASPLFGFSLSSRLRSHALPDQANRDWAVLRDTWPGLPMIGLQCASVLDAPPGQAVIDYPFALGFTLFGNP